MFDRPPEPTTHAAAKKMSTEVVARKHSERDSRFFTLQLRLIPLSCARSIREKFWKFAAIL
jgi:hypothetical protein